LLWRSGLISLAGAVKAQSTSVFEQADALMLSAETTLGRYPAECVEVFKRVAMRIERSGGAGYAKVYRQLALYWRIFPVCIDFGRNADESIALAEKFLRRNKLAAPGNPMVIVSDVTKGRATIDSIQLRVLK
jgi:pyruvate kinase